MTQVRSSIARRLGIDIGALTPKDRDVEGFVEVMLDATGRYKQPLTVDRLFGWHSALFPTGRSGMARIRVSQWRDDSAGTLALNARQNKVLSRLLDGLERKMTSSKWATIARCSQDMANRDIALLIDAGLLRRGTGGGRSTHYEIVKV